MSSPSNDTKTPPKSSEKLFGADDATVVLVNPGSDRRVALELVALTFSGEVFGLLDCVVELKPDTRFLRADGDFWGIDTRACVSAATVSAVS